MKGHQESGSSGTQAGGKVILWWHHLEHTNPSVAAEADKQDRSTNGLSTVSAWDGLCLLTFHWLELVTLLHPSAEELRRTFFWWTLVMSSILGLWTKCRHSTLSSGINSLTLSFLNFFPLDLKLLYNSDSLGPLTIGSSMTVINCLECLYRNQMFVSQNYHMGLDVTRIFFHL